jgi:hypothetical protein
MTAGADRWTTTGCVTLALIAGTVSYLHMHRLMELNGRPDKLEAAKHPIVDRENDPPFGSLLINALVLIGLANFRVAGNPDSIWR